MGGKVATPEALRGNVRTIPLIDKTLTKEGQAADAKAVGDALAEHKGVLDDHKATLDSHKETLAAHKAAIDNASEESAAADNRVRQEFAEADSAVREAFAAADNGLREDFTNADEEVRTAFAEADDAVRNEFGEADNAVAKMLREEFAEADNAAKEEMAEALGGKAPAGNGGYGEIIPQLGDLVGDMVPNYATESALDAALNKLLPTMELATPLRIRFAVNEWEASGQSSGTAMWDCDIVRTSKDYAMLTGRSLFTGNSVIYIRKVYTFDSDEAGASWKPVEWEDPINRNTVSYLTTELCNGKPVYIACVDVPVPEVTNTDGNTVIIMGYRMGDTFNNVRVCSISGCVNEYYADSGDLYKAYPLSDVNVVCVRYGATGITVKVTNSNSELAGTTAHIIVKFTKD